MVFLLYVFLIASSASICELNQSGSVAALHTKRAHCKNIHCHHPHPRHRHHPHDGQQRHPHHPHHPHPHYQNEQHCPHKLKSSSLAPQWHLFPPKELDVKTLENAQQMNS